VTALAKATKSSEEKVGKKVANFVQAEVGMAIVPRITVAQELRDHALEEAANDHPLGRLG